MEVKDLTLLESQRYTQVECVKSNPKALLACWKDATPHSDLGVVSALKWKMEPTHSFCFI